MFAPTKSEGPSHFIVYSSGGEDFLFHDAAAQHLQPLSVIQYLNNTTFVEKLWSGSATFRTPDPNVVKWIRIRWP